MLINNIFAISFVGCFHILLVYLPQLSHSRNIKKISKRDSECNGELVPFGNCVSKCEELIKAEDNRRRIKILRDLEEVDGKPMVCCDKQDVAKFQYCSLKDDPQLWTHAKEVSSMLKKVHCGSGYESFKVRLKGKARKAKPRDNPWVAMLAYNEQMPDCGAVLVSDRHLVTAAHCLTIPGRYTVIFDPQNYGFSKVSDCFDGSACKSEGCSDELDDNCVRLKVIQENSHPQYNTRKTVSNFDIGFLTLEREIFATPICLPDIESDEELKPQTDVSMKVWDVGSFSEFTTQEKKLSFLEERFRINSDEECNQKIGKSLSALKLCVGQTNTSTSFVCNGDSGFGIYKEKEDGAEELVGVTSYGLNNCNTDAVFTKISGPILRWVLNKLYDP